MTGLEMLRAAVTELVAEDAAAHPGSQAAAEAIELGRLIDQVQGIRLRRLRVVHDEGT